MEWEELIREGCPFPTVDLGNICPPKNGFAVEAPNLCSKKFPDGSCRAFYESLERTKDGARTECPYGFSVWPIQIGGTRLAVTGVIAYPRTGSRLETARAREGSRPRIDVAALDRWLSHAKSHAAKSADREREGVRRSLEALHEVRRLNGTVRTIMERVCEQESNRAPEQADPDLVRAWKASELMAMQMAALDLLANPGIASSKPTGRGVFYQLVDKIVRIYRPAATARKIDLRFTGQSTDKILFDYRTFHIMPSAFVDNAIKYAPRGSKVSVTVSREYRDKQPFVSLEVTNEGPLASREEYARIFKLRGRGHLAQLNAEGTGVGLVLAQQVAKQHNAELSVAQEPISGTRSKWSFSLEMESVD